MGQIREIPLEKIVADPDQPRRHFDEAKLRGLASSIAQTGLIHPVTVRPRDGGKFELVHGERRYRAHLIAGLSTIRAEVRDLNDEEVLQIQLVENLQRENLTPLEEAETFRRMVKDLGWTHREIGSKVGKSRTYVTNKLRLLALPSEVQKRLREGSLSEGQARALLSLETDDRQIDVARKVVEKQLRVRETELLVRDWGDVSRETSAKNDSVKMIEVDQLAVFKAVGSSKSVPLDRLLKAYMEDFKRLRGII